MSAVFKRNVRSGQAGVIALAACMTPAAHAERPVFAGVGSLAGWTASELRGIAAAEIVGVRIEGRAPATLSVQRFDVFAPGAIVVEGGQDGVRAMPRPDVAFFRGEVVGEPGMRVFLAVAPRGMTGYVQAPDGLFALSSNEAGEGGAAFVAVNAVGPAEPYCGGDRLLAEGRQWIDDLLDGVPPVDMANTPRTSAACRAAEIAVETDWEFTSNLFAGNTQASATYAATLLAAASELYRRELGVGLVISFLRVWGSNTDPYTTDDAFLLLEQFRVHWNSAAQSVHRDVAFLLSGRNTVGAGGLAYLYGLCDTAGYGYGMAGRLTGSLPFAYQDYSSQNWDLFVISHEMGHCFGAVHTHVMNPPLDQCGSGNCGATLNLGTIMSSCHTCPGGVANIQMTFHERVISERIMPFVDNVACDLAVAHVPCLGDADGSGVVDFGDITAVLAQWGGAGPLGDANFNSVVNFEDLTYVLGAWDGVCPCP